MQLQSVKQLILPLIKGGHKWQHIDINGNGETPRFLLSGTQWFILLVSALILIRFQTGISKEIIGYVMAAFSISVSLFMSLLVSIFDKFEKTDFERFNKTEDDTVHLIQ